MGKSEELHPWCTQQIGYLPLSEIEKKISYSNNVLWKGLRLEKNMSNEKCYLWLMFAQIIQFQSKVFFLLKSEKWKLLCFNRFIYFLYANRYPYDQFLRRFLTTIKNIFYWTHFPWLHILIFFTRAVCKENLPKLYRLARLVKEPL